MSTNTDGKFVLASKSIQGAILAVLPFLLPALGISFSEDQAQLISGHVDQVMTGLGGLWAVIGLRTASKPLKGLS